MKRGLALSNLIEILTTQQQNLLENKLYDVFGDLFETEFQQAFHHKVNAGELKEIVELYKKDDAHNLEQKSPDHIISKIVNIIVQNFLENLPQKYARLTLEDIEISTQEKQNINLKFDVNFELEPLKPFIEFSVKMNGQKIKSDKMVFEVNSSGKFTQIQINLDSSKQTSDKENNERKISLGTLEALLEIKITKLPFSINLNEPYTILSRELILDLSDVM